MKQGILNVAAATPEIRVADCAYNAGQIIELMKQAAAQGVQVLVLPELCLTGSTCGDLFWQETLLEGRLVHPDSVEHCRKFIPIFCIID